MTDEITDITIIGGGPTGLFSTFYAGMRQMSVRLIDSLPELGGQLTELYPDKYIYDVGGFPKILAKDLVDNLVEQAQYADPEFHLGETVQSYRKEDDHFVLTPDQGEYLTRTILITAGVGAFQPRKLGLDNEAEFEGASLQYAVRDLAKFRDKDVVVLGGGDSALDWALMLEDLAKSVTLVHRRERFTAHENTVQKVKNSSVNVKTSLNVTEIRGEAGQIEELVLSSKKGDDEEVIKADQLIVNFGNISSLGPLKEWGLKLDKNSIEVDAHMETNIAGIFAAGDVTTFEGKVKLIATGFGEAPVAISYAKSSYDSKSRIQPKHSTAVFKQD